jgi:hypothetical protein
MRAGFDATFTKPTPVDELLRTIRDARSGWRQNATDRRAEPRRRLLSPT